MSAFCTATAGKLSCARAGCSPRDSRVHFPIDVATQHLLSQLLQDPLLQSIPRQFDSGACRIALSGITPAAKPAYLALLHRILNRPVLFLSAGVPDLEAMAATTAFYHGSLSGNAGERVAVFPALEPGPYSGLSPHAEAVEQRTLALWKIHRRTLDILLCGPTALVTRLPEVLSDFQQAPELAPGREISLDELIGYLKRAGYVNEEPVTGVGAFSRRGGILDVYPPGSRNPARIEFFGDEIESLREFSVSSQRSVGHLKSVTPVPMREAFVDPESLQKWSRKASERWNPRDFPVFFETQVVQAGRGVHFQGFECLHGLTLPLQVPLLDFVGDFVVVRDEPDELEEGVRHWWDEVAGDREALSRRQWPSLNPEEVFLSLTEVGKKLERRPVIDLQQLGTAPGQQSDRSLSLPPAEGETASRPADSGSQAAAAPAPIGIDCQTAPVRKYHGDIASLARDLRQGMEAGVRLLFAQSSSGRAERLGEMLREYDLPVVFDFDAKDRQADGMHARIAVVVGHVLEGFRHHSSKICIFGDEDVFDEVEFLSHPAPSRSRSGIFVSDFRELTPGDYVVHVDHGIGRYRGLKQIGRDGVNQEFMILEYFEEARLYVPLERLDLVQKHSSGDSAHPPLDKLGGVSWKKAKARARKSIRDMAQELLKLYARRRIAPGYRFSSNGHWHQEFEAAFEFTETPDQREAIKDLYRDMELNNPMDRLLCGDVGFGKTEVAMRAAFKAAFDGKQCAVLAPTTILVYQHYLRFRQRFTAFPITIEMLSRFRSPKEQKAILERVATGKVDILIGTHRMLSKDIQFRDLGLLIVDEEQRFGVAHKERLRQLKQNVDTLAMTATPIPRTLHMSLMGIRDMSVIETPPRDRLSIQTSVLPFSRQVIQNALRHELERQGQAYFVHNKVETIDSFAALVREICPEARLLVAHGQMKEKALETTLLKFLRHEADVLVATTIIENGLDIPLVNTMIVNRADQFGLSQLYQLRGRVGRSSRRAYAYLLVPPRQTLSGIARQRLAALKEFSVLGSGFKVAALDLELRGAGNLLGGEQHGHINNIGFDLYCQLLERTIRELQGEEVLPEIQTRIDLKVSVKIPPDYIPEENQRLSIYKRISSLKLDSEMDALREELEDRYGPLPEEVERLLDYMRVRRLAEGILVESMERDRQGIAITFHHRTPIPPHKLVETVSSVPGLSVSPGGQLRLRSAGVSHGEVLSSVRALLGELAS